jgi:hypothetical protein
MGVSGSGMRRSPRDGGSSGISGSTRTKDKMKKKKTSTTATKKGGPKNRASKQGDGKTVSDL